LYLCPWNWLRDFIYRVIRTILRIMTKPFRKSITINCIHSDNQRLFEEANYILKYFQHTANQEQNDQCGNQHYSRELLMMGIVVPETC